MITMLSGTIHDIQDQHITLDVQGVGYAVSLAKSTSYEQGQQVKLYTHMHWNQENGPTLYGFATSMERSVFLLITSCSGIGPKIGLAILSAMAPSQFLEVIQLGDEKALSAINGIGGKKAEQLIVHLKHKVAKLIDQGVSVGDSVTLENRHNISQVLKSLNYSKQEITAAMHYLNEHYPTPTLPFDQLMRHALSFLAKKM